MKQTAGTQRAPAKVPSPIRAERPQHRAASRPETSAVPSIVREVLASPGQPLDANTRASTEARFGHDFGRVRVHTDARAAESARAVGALAYTVGRDIAFGAGRYSPATQATNTIRFAHDGAYSAYWGSRTIYVEPGSPTYKAMLDDIAAYVREIEGTRGTGRKPAGTAKDPSERTMAGSEPPDPTRDPQEPEPGQPPDKAPVEKEPGEKEPGEVAPTGTPPVAEEAPLVKPPPTEEQIPPVEEKAPVATPDQPAPAVVRSGWNEPWTPPKHYNAPVKHGVWTGPRGNSSWIDDRPQVMRIVGKDPVTNKANPIDFYKGVADFSKWSQEELTIPGLTGDHTHDMPLIREAVAKKHGLKNKTAALGWLRDADDGYGGKGLNPPHAGGDKVQLIPKDLHSKVQHTDITHP